MKSKNFRGQCQAKFTFDLRWNSSPVADGFVEGFVLGASSVLLAKPAGLVCKTLRLERARILLCVDKRGSPLATPLRGRRAHGEVKGASGLDLLPGENGNVERLSI